MTELHVAQENIGDLALVAPGDTVYLHGAIRGLSFDLAGRAGVTFSGALTEPRPRLLGEGQPSALYGQGEGLILDGLDVSGYTPGQQRGAIQGADGLRWHIEDCVVHHNGKGGHGYGLRLGHGMTILESRFNDNGSMGLSGIGDDILIEDVEIARNNWREDWDDAQVEAWLLEAAEANPRFPGTYDHSWTDTCAFGVDPFWEGGGAKLVRTRGFVARRLHVHHNGGRGWWPDIQNVGGYTEDLTAEWNAGEGYANELGGQWALDWWTARYNGMGDRRGWLWGAQAIHQNVTDSEAKRGLAVVHAIGGNGLAQVNQNRTPRAARNAYRDTVLVYESDRGRHGYVSDADGGSPLTWEAVRIIGPGDHLSTHGPLLPGGVGPQPEEVGARVLPAFSGVIVEPPPSGGWWEARVAQADDFLAQGVQALDSVEAMVEQARQALSGLHSLAVTPFDIEGSTDEELIAEQQRLRTEADRRLIEQQ